MSVLYLTNDLMFSSRVVSVARQLGIPVTVVGSRARLEEQLAAAPTAMILIDLEHRDAVPKELAELVMRSTPRPQTIAYGPHVKESLLAAAQTAGLDLVLSRGQFDKQFASLLQTLASPS